MTEKESCDMMDRKSEVPSMDEEWNIELDPAFAERDLCRKKGIPVEIARTGRLLIRETVLADVPKLYQIWQEPGMGDYISPLQPTLEEELDFMRAYICHAYAYYDFGLWTVLEEKSGKIVGRAGLFPSEILENAVELGYMIAPQFQRRGYAKECGKAILAYAEEVLDMEEIHLLTDCRNLASLRTAAALGFTAAGRLSQKDRELVHLARRTVS